MGYPTQPHIDDVKTKAEAASTAAAAVKAAWNALVTANETLAQATADALTADIELKAAAFYSVTSSNVADMTNAQSEIDAERHNVPNSGLFGDNSGPLPYVPNVTAASLADIEVEYFNLVASRMDRLTTLLAAKTAADTAVTAATSDQATKDSDWVTAIGVHDSATGDLATAMATLRSDI